MKLTSGRHPGERKQHLIKEAHFLYLATNLATKNLNKINTVSKMKAFHMLENNKNEIYYMNYIT